VRKLFLPFLGLLTGLAWSGLVAAVGFGSITVTSSLGQPLVAEIELVAVDRADKSSLVAQLASIEAFKGAGIEYPRTLPKLKFQLLTRANGDAYIKASSDQPLNEPFVSLLIELNWASGRLLREYTFLLDPPGFVPEKPPVQTVQPIEPVTPIASAQEALPPVTAAIEPEPVPAVTQSLAPEQTPLPVEKPAPVVPEVIKPKVANAPSAQGQIKVKRGDTLSAIARQQKSPEVSLERMLVALYRANQGAFEGKNMNRLRVGKILRVPEQSELSHLPQADAAHEVHVQVADWNAYRQKLASVRNQSAENHPRQAVSGKITPLVAEHAPTVKPAAQEVLRLSKGEASGDHVATAGKKSAQEQANAREEEAVAHAKAAQETQQRTAALEKNIADMQRLVDLKNQAAASAPVSAVAAASAVLPVSAVASVSAVTAASAVVPVKPKLAIPAPKVELPPPSLIDVVLSNPMYLGAGAAVLLGLGALAWMRFRRAKDDGEMPPENHEQAVNALSRIAEPVAPSPDTGDFTNMAATTVVQDNAPNEVDPIGEAELFLNYGRDAQAEEVLREALLKDPENIPVKLKLLSIFALRKDTQSFQALALEIESDPAAWLKAAAMGREFDPTNPLYGINGDEVAEIETDQSGEQAAPAVDFDLDFGQAESEPMMMTALDLDMGQEPVVGEHTMIMSADEIQAAQIEPMDFDITATHPGIKVAEPVVEEVLELSTMDFDLSAMSPQVEVEPAIAEPEALAIDLNAMDFDLTESHPNVPLLPEAEAVAEFTMPEMDFDLTSSPAKVAEAVEPAVEIIAPEVIDLGDSAEVVAETTPALSLDDLIFDVTGSHADLTSSPTENLTEAPKAIDTFSLDFPQETSNTPEPVSAVPMRDLGLSEISLQLDEADSMLEPEQTAVKNEQWQEVATKLDLAKAYQEMGDLDGAREILAEVVLEGDEVQRQTAEELIQQLV
jgi:pilus assembly protein FimV